MANKDYSRFFGTDMAGAFPGMTGFGFDFQSIMDTYRKNIEAVSDAQQLAFENIQAIAQRQGELLTRIVEDNSSLAREIMSEKTPEQKVARQADLMKKTYDNSIDSFRELAEMINKSGIETSGVLSKRVSASLAEFKSVLEKSGKATASARQKTAA